MLIIAATVCDVVCSSIYAHRPDVTDVAVLHGIRFHCVFWHGMLNVHVYGFRSLPMRDPLCQKEVENIAVSMICDLF